MTSTAFLDPSFGPIVAGLAALPPMAERSLDEARHGIDLSIFGTPDAVREVRDLQVPTPDGEVAARLYRPSGATDRPRALMVYFHGGGWVFGSLETHDIPLRRLANRANVAILAVDYRLAPEHPFPHGLNDCCAVLGWAAKHLPDLVGAEVPLMIGGDSAGGNLAAVIALKSRDAGGPPLTGQLLLYPVTDGRCDSSSYETVGDCALLTSRDMRWFWDQYASPPLRHDPMVSPVRAASHANLPAAIVVIAGVDPLCDEGRAYAELMRAAGTPVTVLQFDTLPHGFFNFVTLTKTADAALTDIASVLDALIVAAVG